jgi:hypothetical protein
VVEDPFQSLALAAGFGRSRAGIRDQVPVEFVMATA